MSVSTVRSVGDSEAILIAITEAGDGDTCKVACRALVKFQASNTAPRSYSIHKVTVRVLPSGKDAT